MSARGERAAFALATTALVGASLFAGATLTRYLAARAQRSDGAGLAPLARLVEHAALDVQLGRGAEVLDALGQWVPRVSDRAAGARLCELWAAAALQAGRLDVAERAEAERAARATTPSEHHAIALQQIGIYGALGQRRHAETLADALIHDAPDPALADEARWRVMAATFSDKELRTWVTLPQPGEIETVRRLGWTALRLLGDVENGARLLGLVERAGQKDASLYAGLIEANRVLGRHAEVARLAAALQLITPEARRRDELEVVRAEALARAGDGDGALAALERLLARTRDLELRQAARQLRYRLLVATGRLEAEIALVDRRHDRATRAWIALTIEHDHALAERLYGELGARDPDSQELAAGAREAARLRALDEEKARAAEALARDPGDATARAHLVTALAQLGDGDALRRLVAQAIAGHEDDSPALVTLAATLARAGLLADAAHTLERAYAVERAAARRQTILIALGELYATGDAGRARQLFGDLAAVGVSPAIREEAIAHLASLLER
jgi:hypothetical protein